MLWATQVPVHGHFWANLAGPFFVAGHRHRVRLHPGLDRRARRGRRARGRPRVRAAQHLPAARRRDRRRDRVHGRRHPRQDPAPPGRRTSRGAHRRLPVGVLGLRRDRPGRGPGDLPAGPPQRASHGGCPHIPEASASTCRRLTRPPPHTHQGSPACQRKNFPGESETRAGSLVSPFVRRPGPGRPRCTSRPWSDETLSRTASSSPIGLGRAAPTSVSSCPFLGQQPTFQMAVGRSEDADEAMRRLADLARPKLGP